MSTRFQNSGDKWLGFTKAISQGPIAPDQAASAACFQQDVEDTINQLVQIRASLFRALEFQNRTLPTSVESELVATDEISAP